MNRSSSAWFITQTAIHCAALPLACAYAGWPGAASILGNYLVALIAVLICGLIGRESSLGRHIVLTLLNCCSLVILAGNLTCLTLFQSSLTTSRVRDAWETMWRSEMWGAVLGDRSLLGFGLLFILVTSTVHLSARRISGKITLPMLRSIRRPAPRFLSVVAASCVLGLVYPSSFRSSLLGLALWAPSVRPAAGMRHTPLRLRLGELRQEVLSPLPRIDRSRVRQNLLVIVLESVSARYIDSFGAPTGGASWPNASRLAQQSLRALNHHSITGGSSVESDWSLITGLFPRTDGVSQLYNVPKIAHRSLFYYFAAEGYRTGVVCPFSLGQWYTDRLYRGDHVETVVEASHLEHRLATAAADPTDTDAVSALLELLSANDDRPFAFLLRLNSTHWPYTWATRDRTLSDLDRYKAGLEKADEEIGRILDFLDGKGLLSHTTVVLTSDHGEAFGQHDNIYLHSNHVYEELTHVPFILYAPHLGAPSRAITAPTSHIDLLPTLLDLFALRPEELHELEGYSLLRELPAQRAVFLTESIDGNISGVLRGRYKLVQDISRREALFDLENDPDERVNRLDDMPAQHAELAALLAQWHAHRSSGIGRSRLAAPFETPILALRGNADVTVYRGGDPDQSVTVSERAELPIRLVEGHNTIEFEAVPRFLEKPWMNVTLLFGETRIDTGPWWDSWDGRTWKSAAIGFAQLTGANGADVEPLFALSPKKPTILRLRLTVRNGAIITEEVALRSSGHKMWLEVDGSTWLWGNRNYSRLSASFPSLPASPRTVRIVAITENDSPAVLVKGSIGGLPINSGVAPWQSAAAKSSSYAPVLRRQAHAAPGDWGAQGQWMAHHDDGAREVRFLLELGSGP